MAQYSRKLSKGIKWFYKFDFKHETFRSDCIYLSKFEAKRAENARYEEVQHNKQNPTEKPILSLQEAINERLDYVKNKKGKGYYNINRLYYSELLAHLGNVPLDSISRKDINSFLFNVSSEAKKRGKDNYAVNYRLNIFKSLFNYAIDEHELLMRNPCNKITLFSVKKKLKYIPSNQDIEAVRLLCDDNQKQLIDFVSETGARINEPLKVTGKDIFADYVILYTKKSKNSNIVPRKVPIPEFIKKIKLQYKERLFPQWNDTPKFLKRKIKSLNQKEWSWHNLRHRRASLWSKHGLPLYEIMSLLGHSNLKTTQNYLQLLE